MAVFVAGRVAGEEGLTDAEGPSSPAPLSPDTRPAGTMANFSLV